MLITDSDNLLKNRQPYWVKHVNLKQVAHCQGQQRHRKQCRLHQRPNQNAQGRPRIGRSSIALQLPSPAQGEEMRRTRPPFCLSPLVPSTAQEGLQDGRRRRVRHMDDLSATVKAKKEAKKDASPSPAQPPKKSVSPQKIPKKPNRSLRFCTTRPTSFAPN